MFASSKTCIIIGGATIAIVSAGGCGYGLRPTCGVAHYEGPATSNDPTASYAHAVVWYDPGDQWPTVSGGPADDTGSSDVVSDPSVNDPTVSAPDANGCYSCRVVCHVGVSAGALYREATAWSGSSHGDACGVAEQALAHWAHAYEFSLLSSCAREPAATW
jgi:hypothetical protein